METAEDINTQIRRMYMTGKYSYRNIAEVLKVPKGKVELQVAMLLDNINELDKEYAIINQNVITEDMMINRSDDYSIIKRYNTPSFSHPDFKTRLNSKQPLP